MFTVWNHHSLSHCNYWYGFVGRGDQLDLVLVRTMSNILTLSTGALDGSQSRDWKNVSAAAGS